MSVYTLVLALTLGVAVVIAFVSRRRAEERLAFQSLRPGRKTYLVEPLMLPMMLAMAAVLLAFWGGTTLILVSVGRLWLIFLHISAYYLVLLLLLPLLRRLISAQACAALWLMPTLLYFLLWFIGQERPPLVVLTLPRRYAPVLLALWLGGFVVVLLRQLFSHLRFRRTLLRESEEVTDLAILNQWHSQLRRHGVKADIPILISPLVTTPLTVGCFDRTMRLVLPRCDYTEAEYKLIFRHELRHILRCDSRTKLFLSFCVAMCWFNPLCWIARRKAAEDLELSCDEAVLADADPDTRRQYAELLLKSAGSGAGYTTCLSAAAATLRYRLRNVMRPARRLSGALAVGVALVGLILSFGVVALADGPTTAQEAIFDQAPPITGIDSLSVESWSGGRSSSRRVYGYDEPALTQYLSELPVRHVYVGNYAPGQQRQMHIRYCHSTPEGETAYSGFTLCDGLLLVNLPYDDFGNIAYLVDGTVDWSYIDSLLDYDAPDPDPSPRPPELFLHFTGPDGASVQGQEGEPLFAQSRVLEITDAYGSWVPERDIPSPGGCFGLALDQARLEFSYPPESYTVTVERWDGSERYTLPSQALTEDTFPLASYSAHYTIRGSFDTVRETHYEMEFYFDVGLPVDEALWEKTP